MPTVNFAAFYKGIVAVLLFCDLVQATR